MRIIIFRLCGYSNMLHPELQQNCNFPVCFFYILYTEHTAILLSVFSDNNPDQVTDRSRFPLHTNSVLSFNLDNIEIRYIKAVLFLNPISYFIVCCLCFSSCNIQFIHIQFNIDMMLRLREFGQKGYCLQPIPSLNSICTYHIPSELQHILMLHKHKALIHTHSQDNHY